jgi:hypothetical protein
MSRRRESLSEFISVRFIFCGIGRTLDEIIGSHLSADQALSPVELEPLPHEARWAIVENAGKKLGLRVGKEYLIRIGQISDGLALPISRTQTVSASPSVVSADVVRPARNPAP